MKNNEKQIECKNGICSFTAGAVKIKYRDGEWSAEKEQALDSKLAMCFRNTLFLLISVVIITSVALLTSPELNPIIVAALSSVIIGTIVMSSTFLIFRLHKNCILGFETIGYFYRLKGCAVCYQNGDILLKPFNSDILEYVTLGKLMELTSNNLASPSVPFTVHESKPENICEPKLIMDFTNGKNADIYVV